MFFDPTRRQVYVDWERTAATAVANFRHVYASYRKDPLFAELLEQLMRSNEFARLWRRWDVLSPADTAPFLVRHRTRGICELRPVQATLEMAPGWRFPSPCLTAGKSAKQRPNWARVEGRPMSLDKSRVQMTTTADVSRRQDLAAFLRARRNATRPEDLGLEREPGRHVPGLRREEVAALAGISTTWYTWIEQGREITVSPEVLVQIARALHLAPRLVEYMGVLSGAIERRDRMMPSR